jgi:hypothetical protein
VRKDSSRVAARFLLAVSSPAWRNRSGRIAARRFLLAVISLRILDTAAIIHGLVLYRGFT